MRILADQNIPLIEAFFGELGDITRLPGREIDAAAVRDHDILLVRSITRVDAALLEGSRVRFVGTCTIGTDHVDLDYLRERHIGFASAPGSNADSVVDYVLSSLLLLAEEEGEALSERSVGIVGAGNVGGRLARRLGEMGVRSLICDPPRARDEGREDFVDLDTLIARSDVICLHTPLVEAGEHATHHLMDARRVAAIRPGSVLLNAGRGACLDNAALRRRLEEQADLRCVLDVWEQEPAIDEALFALVDIATPHIAGHSLDGKMRGTELVYQAVMQHYGLPVRCKLGQIKPDPWLRKLVLTEWAPPLEALSLCVRACYDVRRDMVGFERYRRRLGMAQAFDRYRAEYPVRREFSTLRVDFKKNNNDLREAIAGFGFKVKLAGK
ncbi:MULTISPECIES: 4-phosphoerythronate dehydrogenase PdxB [unclassified Modicisalibacter]|uniref:4-phosphoerythronate dehydrogenase PdxB n=1 Tax=unclassified Modicisalibacter TaxID=2679913 RepID=UPI001CCF7AB2|nr:MULTISPECIES: 4-phosphoerythronate dehydrogenase PdxB [unclassified Modicisalibacter]MBZ9557362.1 4-phosphoerythronate dehydrogenase PdxB [Modicisalibacter sp. R2A 31.J]MBZ9573972.1 4-phosphoerythronate dehydrogenase PdxB [Modicisalibacter sp. MOD 31.J]